MRERKKREREREEKERERERRRRRKREREREGEEKEKRVKFQGELSQTKVVKQNCSSPNQDSPSEIGLKYLFLSSK